MRRCLLLLAFLPTMARALDLDYDGTLAGAHLARLHLHVETNGPAYLARLHFQTINVAAAFAHGQTDSLSQGSWAGANAVPFHADSEGIWNGTLHRLVIDWRNGIPTAAVQSPPDPRHHEPIPLPSFQGATDGLGLVAALLRQLVATGQCDRHATVAGPHSVVAFSFTTGPMQTIVYGPFAGPARRCDFTSHKIAGFGEDENRHRTDRGFALYGLAAGGLPAVPLRITFQTGFWGDAVLTLTAITH